MFSSHSLFLRRDFLRRTGTGLGMLGLADLLAGGGKTLAAGPVPHFQPKAKRVIHFFLNGGPSHADTFDPKPELERHAGKSFPGNAVQVGNVATANVGTLMPSQFSFSQHGKSGI